MLDFLINYHKRKLEKMILNNESYDTILKQSQKLDKYIVTKMKQIMEYSNKKSMDVSG